MLSKIYIKSYAEALSNSNNSIINTNTIIDNNSPINSDRSHRNSNNINQTSNSIVLEHITDANKNNNYVNCIVKYLDINTNTISNVVYSSKLVTIIFNSQHDKVKLFLYKLKLSSELKKYTLEIILIQKR